MQTNSSVIRIGISPITPAQIMLEFWPKIHAICPDLKFQLVPYVNTVENAREILANLGQNIDVVAGIFDDTMLNLRQCAGLEIQWEPLCCAVSLHHPLAEKKPVPTKENNRLQIPHRYSVLPPSASKPYRRQPSVPHKKQFAATQFHRRRYPN